MGNVASMTGYANVSGTTPIGTVTIECRSVNGRFLDLTLRTPEELRRTEPAVRELIQKKVRRGKMEVRLSLKVDAASTAPTLDKTVLERLLSLQDEIKTIHPNAREMGVSEMLAAPGVVKAETPDEDELRDAIIQILTECLDQFSAARQREGEALAKVLLGYCDGIEETVNDVEKRMPDILMHIRSKLEERLESALANTLTEKSTLSREEVAERIRQEVTLYALRIDVDEEMNRLRTHVNEVRRILSKGGDIGRRLDFMVQEMNREANTLGSKAAAIEMTNASLKLKLFIEQMREQIQNLE